MELWRPTGRRIHAAGVLGILRGTGVDGGVEGGDAGAGRKPCPRMKSTGS